MAANHETEKTSSQHTRPGKPARITAYKRAKETRTRKERGIMSESNLSEREMAIARAAAKIAVKEMTDGFYQEVGKTVVKRFFILVGLGFVAFSAGKGWITFGDIFK